MQRSEVILRLSSLLVCALFSSLLALQAQSSRPEEAGTDSLAIVVGSNPGPVRSFAAQELARYLERMTGQKIRAGATARHRIYIGEVPGSVGAQRAAKFRQELAGLAADGFLIRKAGNDIVILGQGERGEIYGCYALLERMGVRWFFPGPEHEVVPRRPLNWSGPLDVTESPAFPERILFYWPHSYTRFEDWIDFSAKVRLNRIAFHYTWPARDWYINLRERLLPEIKKRGLTVEVGGHFLSYFLPRTLFEQEPDWFRMNEKGARTPDFNFNPFSSEALEYVGSRTVEYLTQMPEARLFHVWADDISGGGWTHEPGKEDYTASDQALLVSNDVLRRLRKELPEANLAFLAYHDTVYPPRVVKPDPGVVYFYAPRERCYGHALDSPDCPLNQIYRRALEQGLPAFGSANAEVFEYYVDQILYENLTNPPLPDVVAADLRYYRRLGIPAVGALMTNTAEFVTPMVNMFLYPQALWNPQRDLNEPIKDYATLYFGDASLTAYFEQLRIGLEDVLKVCEFTIPGNAWDHLRVEGESDAALKSHVDRIERALVGPLPKAASLLRAASSKAQGKTYRARLEGESTSMRYTLLQAKLYYHLLKGEYYYRLWKNSHSPEAGRGALRESVLAHYTWEKQKKLVASAGIKGQPLIPDPAVLQARVKEITPEGYSVEGLEQHLAGGVLGSIVSTPVGSAAVLWTDVPSSAASLRLGAAGLNWRDEFGQPLEKTRLNLSEAPAVAEAPDMAPEKLFSVLARSQEEK